MYGGGRGPPLRRGGVVAPPTKKASDRSSSPSSDPRKIFKQLVIKILLEITLNRIENLVYLKNLLITKFSESNLEK